MFDLRARRTIITGQSQSWELILFWNIFINYMKIFISNEIYALQVSDSYLFHALAYKVFKSSVKKKTTCVGNIIFLLRGGFIY